jgi:hypothetical protein
MPGGLLVIKFVDKSTLNYCSGHYLWYITTIHVSIVPHSQVILVKYVRLVEISVMRLLPVLE